MSVDLNLFQIIGVSHSNINVETVGETRWEGNLGGTGIVNLKGVEKTFIVFVDNPAKAPGDTVYYIKVFELPVVGERHYYFGMDWGGKDEEDFWEETSYEEPTLVYEFSIYTTLDETPDFYTHIKGTEMSIKYMAMQEARGKFKGTTGKDKYFACFTRLFEEFSKPPVIPEKKECVHMGRKQKRK